MRCVFGFLILGQGDRSPTDVVLSPDGRRAVTANHTSDSITLVDLEAGTIVVEAQVGRRPFAVALSAERVVVSNWLSDSISILDSNLRPQAEVKVGHQPRGVALLGDRAFVALSGENAVAMVNLKAGEVAARIDVGQEPWHVAVSEDRRKLVVGNSNSRTLTIVDVESLQVSTTINARGRNLRHIAVSGSWAYVPQISEVGGPTNKQNIDMGWVIANRLCRVPLDKPGGDREVISMDPRGKAVADLDGLAIAPDGVGLAVASGGTHELLLLRQPLPWEDVAPGDHIDPDLLKDSKRFRRVPLGGRPLGVAFTPDGTRVVVANYLLNAIQIVDFEKGRLVRTIELGSSSQPRKGEAIFYDGQRSFNQWFSCHTCHTDGHTNGGLYDTLNDGRYGNSKKTSSLRGVSKTGPWTWHGWRTNLHEMVKGSMIETMQGPVPTKEEVDALVEFLGTFDFVASPYAASKKGEELFRAKGCVECHKPPLYTSPKVYQVGLEDPKDVYKGFNPPSLRGVYRRAPYLHDGRAKTLEQVLTEFHRPSKLTGEPDLSPEELVDLIAFLKSL